MKWGKGMQAAQKAISNYFRGVPHLTREMYRLMQEREEFAKPIEKKAATKIQARARGMIDRRKAAHAQKQFEIRLNKANARSSGTANFTNGVPVFSMGKAEKTPEPKRKKPRTGLDNTPVGVWRPNAPYPPMGAQTPLYNTFQDVADGMFTRVPDWD